MQSADYSISEARNLFENINREIFLRGSRFEAAVARRFPSASSGKKGFSEFFLDLFDLCNLRSFGVVLD